MLLAQTLSVYLFLFKFSFVSVQLHLLIFQMLLLVIQLLVFLLPIMDRYSLLFHFSLQGFIFCYHSLMHSQILNRVIQCPYLSASNISTVIQLYMHTRQVLYIHNYIIIILSNYIYTHNACIGKMSLH